MQVDDLIGLEAFRFVDRLGIKTPKMEISFGSNHEKSRRLMKLVETGKVHITSVEDIDGSWFYGELVQEIDLVNFAVGYKDHRGDAATQIQKGMKLDGPFALAELGPREERQAQVDRCGIESVDRVFQLDAEVFVGIESSGLGNQDLSKVCIRQSRTWLAWAKVLRDTFPRIPIW